MLDLFKQLQEIQEAQIKDLDARIARMQLANRTLSELFNVKEGEEDE